MKGFEDPTPSGTNEQPEHIKKIYVVAHDWSQL